VPGGRVESWDEAYIGVIPAGGHITVLGRVIGKIGKIQPGPSSNPQGSLSSLGAPGGVRSSGIRPLPG